MNYKRILIYTILVVGLTLDFGCSKKDADAVETALGTSNYLYVASGACYSGNNTTFTAATANNVIYKVDMNSGIRVMTMADYKAFPSNTGDSPAGIADGDSDYFYALVENATAGLRRVEKISKQPLGDRSIFTNNSVALPAQARAINTLASGDLMIDRTTGIEYFTSGGVRITVGGVAYDTPSAAPCALSSTLISKFKFLSNDKVVFTHAAAGQNRIGIMPATGGTACATVQAAPNVNAFPTAMFYDSANTLLFVAYAGNATTTDLNSIYAYTINESTGAFTNPQKVYDASLFPYSGTGTYSYLLYGISEMAYDPASKSVFIATATSTATTVVNYSIEKFTYDPSQLGVDNTKVLTRVENNGQAFYRYGGDTSCISAMMITN